MLNFVYAIIFCMIGMCLFDTYYVPTTLVVSSWIWSPLNIRAIPKSEISGFSSVSNKTLLVLRSLWIILNLESWWRYKILRAISMMISKHFLQFNNELPVWSTTKNFSSVLKIRCFMYFKIILWTYIIRENKINECNRSLERSHTKNEGIQVFVGHGLINQHLFSLLNKVLKPGPDCTVRPEKPQTVHFCGSFNIKNHSKGKK